MRNWPLFQWICLETFALPFAFAFVSVFVSTDSLADVPQQIHSLKHLVMHLMLWIRYSLEMESAVAKCHVFNQTLEQLQLTTSIDTEREDFH